MSVAAAAEAMPALACAAVVLGGDAEERQRAAILLEAAGFGVRSAGPPEPGGASDVALAVLLCPAAEAARVRAIRSISEHHPAAQVLAVMPGGVRDASARRALLAGARGIVRDDDVERALVATARAVLAGQLAVPSTLARQIAPQPLSHREKQILSLVVQGMTNQQIAHRLYLAESTVKTHLSSAFRKLDARSRAEAVARIQDPDGGYALTTPALADLATVPSGA
jgi:DNA-binding NarL/FixJ family response regulator